MSSGKDEQKLFGFHRNILFLGLVSLFTDVSSEMIYPPLPIFLTSVLGVGTTFVGLIEGVAEATASFFNLFSGWTSDRWGRRKAIICGWILYSCVYFGFAWVQSSQMVWVLFAVYGLTG